MNKFSFYSFGPKDSKLRVWNKSYRFIRFFFLDDFTALLLSTRNFSDSETHVALFFVFFRECCFDLLKFWTFSEMSYRIHATWAPCKSTAVRLMSKNNWINSKWLESRTFEAHSMLLVRDSEYLGIECQRSFFEFDVLSRRIQSRIF